MSALSALFESVRSDALPTLRAELADAPALARAVDEQGVSALMLAARLDRPGAAALLLEAGAALEARDRIHDSTALAWAAYYGSVRVAELLLAAGAARAPVNAYGLTPAQIAEGGARGEHAADAPGRAPADFRAIIEGIAARRS